MKRIEYIWRQLCCQTIEQNQPNFTMLGLAKQFSLSTSVVSYALNPLREMGIVRIAKNKSQVVDIIRLLFFWATRRNISKDIRYTTSSQLPVIEIEALMPAGVLPTGYSGYRLYLDAVPADYDTIYFYSNNINKVQQRFPAKQSSRPNIIILQPDQYLLQYKKTPLAQIFVDLWNLPQWYASDFTEALLLKIKSKVGL